MNAERIQENPIREHIAAISAGLYDGGLVLDLDYEEDSVAEMDANFVVSESGKFVEVQSTGEQHPFEKSQLNELMDMAAAATQKLIDLQKQVLS